jgi:hypothetical protein
MMIDMADEWRLSLAHLIVCPPQRRDISAILSEKSALFECEARAFTSANDGLACSCGTER